MTPNLTQKLCTISEIWALSSTDANIPTRLQNLRDKAAQDSQYQELYSIILNGFPAHCHQLLETYKQFWAIKEHLSIHDGLIVYGCQLLIPKTMHPQVIADLHEAHQGMVVLNCNLTLHKNW